MQPLVFSKKITFTRSGFLVWIPKDIVEHAQLDDGMFVEVQLRHLSAVTNQTLMSPGVFLKRIKQTGKNYSIWIPKDVSEFLQLSKGSLVQVQLIPLSRQYQSIK